MHWLWDIKMSHEDLRILRNVYDFCGEFSLSWRTWITERKPFIRAYFKNALKVLRSQDKCCAAGYRQLVHKSEGTGHSEPLYEKANTNWQLIILSPLFLYKLFTENYVPKCLRIVTF